MTESKPPQRGRIFISYRRADSEGYAGRIYDRLVPYFGDDAIFMDVDDIPAGVDFVKYLENEVQSCDVLITLIGKQWLNVKDERGKRRLDNPNDFVRIEIETALKRDIRVIPVLLGGMQMPNVSDLPENLQSLARRNGLLVYHHSFHADVNRLIKHLENALGEVDEERQRVAKEKAEREAANKVAKEKMESEKVVREKRKREIAKPPKVFISYAWEDDINPWVNELATRLRSDGVNAILDQWELALGDQLTQFMEQSVRESDFVVFICTLIYKRKSDNRKGGVGYEGGIITGEVFAKNNHRKFIPILRKGKWIESAPSWATSKLYIDLSGNPYSDVNYQQLLNTLLGRLPAAPPVKNNTLSGIEERVNEEQPVLQNTYNEIKTNIEFGLYKDAYKKCIALLSHGDDDALLNLFAGIAYSLDKRKKLRGSDWKIIEKHVGKAMQDGAIRSTALAILGCIKYVPFHLSKLYDPSELNLNFIKEELKKEKSLNKELLNLINPVPEELEYLEVQI